MNKDIETAIKALKKNNFNPVEYAETKEEAANIILSWIPKNPSIAGGGAITINQLGIMVKLMARGDKIQPMAAPGMHDQGPKDLAIFSSNALTLDGKLVNTDAGGNRVGAMFTGVKKVILAIGMNKIVKDLDEALERVQQVISPYHAQNISKSSPTPTPCAKDAKCHNCSSPGRICNITTILSKKPPMVQEFAIVVIGQDLGLGWDPSWPQERIDKVKNAYLEEWGKMFANMPKPPVK
jgi:hypothetical protein